MNRRSFFKVAAGAAIAAPEIAKEGLGPVNDISPEPPVYWSNEAKQAMTLFDCKKELARLISEKQSVAKRLSRRERYIDLESLKSFSPAVRTIMAAQRFIDAEFERESSWVRQQIEKLTNPVRAE
jgi:hypothetical protein